MWERLLLASAATLVLYLSLRIGTTAVTPGVLNQTVSHGKINSVLMPQDYRIKSNS